METASFHSTTPPGNWLSWYNRGMETLTRPKPEKATLKLAAPTEFSVDFVQGMADRMAVSYFKYGPVADNAPNFTDTIANLQKRLDKYEETGNTEWLMDVGNFAMIEFMFPHHSKAHFRSTDSKESPGLKLQTGATVHDSPGKRTVYKRDGD